MEAVGTALSHPAPQGPEQTSLPGLDPTLVPHGRRRQRGQGALKSLSVFATAGSPRPSSGTLGRVSA